LYCYAAPCQQACPTHIDVPTFIRRIANDDTRGSAEVIFAENFLGGTCSRVCPVEELCEGACVLNAVDEPIQIGRLQRFATDAYYARGLTVVTPAAPTQRKVLVVGSGAAGLSAAAVLRGRGHEVTVWERRALAGGLSTYGIVPLREPIDVAQREVDQLRRAGVRIETRKALRSEQQLDALRDEFDAVLLATGLGTINQLEIPNEQHAIDGLAYIEAAKLHPEQVTRPVKVAVIGAGNTAIDAAVVAHRLGAEATIVYRRTVREMTAYPSEYAFALHEGVRFEFLSQPLAVELSDGKVIGLRCQAMRLGPIDSSGRASATPLVGKQWLLPADTVIKANGQQRYTRDNAFGLTTDNGYLAVGDDLVTSKPGVWAAGDAIRARGEASTVMAVHDGKVAAAAIDGYLCESCSPTRAIANA
jgi:glutamate synthase (NADPH/NADH) small chain